MRSLYGILLVIILVAMGGAIAYIGDKLGSKVGKKKLSIFGMRPKHTSILVTIITGILITAVTLGVMALSSENVRVALFGLEKLNQQIQETSGNLQEITLKLNQAKAEQEKTTAALKVAQADYKSALDDLEQSQEQITALELLKDSLADQKQTLEARVTALSQERTTLESDIERFKALTKHLSEGLQFVREGDIIYRSGEVILSKVLPYEDGSAKISAGLLDIFGIANQSVLNRLGIKEQVEAIWVSQADFNQAVQQIADSKVDTVVRIVAAGNIVYGEPVRARIDLFPNKKIYNADQEIYSQIFDRGNLNDEGEAEKFILSFLKQINIAASQKGVIPDPLNGTVGVMNGAQFYDIINDIMAMHGNLKITAYAKDDTNAVGPLRLKIIVTPLK